MKFNKDVALAALAIALFIGAHAAVDALDRRDAEKVAEKEAPVYVVEVSEPVDMPHPIVPKEEARARQTLAQAFADDADDEE